MKTGFSLWSFFTPEKTSFHYMEPLQWKQACRVWWVCSAGFIWDHTRARALPDIMSGPHFLYTFLEGKKTTPFQFSVPGFREIHRNLKKKNNNNSHESSFRKSPFCTFSCINPGFGRLWDMLRKIFLIPIFIMLQKNAFGQKIFWISCTGSKVPFWQKWKIAKMALLNRCMKFKKIFGQKHSFEALWKWR